MVGRFTFSISVAALLLSVPVATHAAVIISEIMYDVPSSTGADDTREWVEITNTGTAPVDFTGWKFNDGSNHVLNAPPAKGSSGSLTLAPGGVAIIADDATTFRTSLYPSFSGTVIDTTMSLNNAGATLGLIDQTGASEYSVSYTSAQGAAGDGNTLQWNGTSLVAAVPTPGTTSITSASTPSTPASSSSGSPSVYVPPPSAITVSAGADQSAMTEVPVSFSAKVTAKGGAEDSAAKVIWSFGDGSSAEGKIAEKVYRYPGTYLVVATAMDGSAKATDDLVVTVARPAVSIAGVAGEGITLRNDSDGRLDLSNWRIVSGAATFHIPLGMTLLPQASVMFPYAVTNLPVSFEAALEYPNGLVAARYAPSAAQPPAPATGSSLVQAVEPISSPKAAVKPHEQAVIAPAAATELAAAGAAIPAREETAAPSAHGGLFSSPWTYGFLGVVVLAASAFILL